jgi:hypothetical protein
MPYVHTTIDTYTHNTFPNPFYTTLRLYSIQSIVCKQFSDSLWILTIINSSHNMTGSYFDINPDHNQLISWSWVENGPDIDPDNTHNSFPNGKLLAQHTQLTSSIISIATTPAILKECESWFHNKIYTTIFTSIRVKKKNMHAHTHTLNIKNRS